jgi:hypothetical protein
MTLQASGAIAINQINAEFGRGNNLNSYRGTVWYTDAGGSGTFSAGALAMNEFYSKRLSSPTFSFTISSHQDQANLRTLAVNAGWNQSSAVVATIASGIYIYSTGGTALTINGSFPNGVTLVNNGYIMGRGGKGTHATGSSAGDLPTAGTDAIALGVACTIQNNSYIGGGGGGGGGVILLTGSYTYGGVYPGGGGAGGGVGGNSFTFVATPNPVGVGGAGGGLGGAGANGSYGVSGTNYYYTGGGGGGRIMPGSSITQAALLTNGTAPTNPALGGQAGGTAQCFSSGSSSIGGGGGSSGSATITIAANADNYQPAGGGGWGAAGGTALGGRNGTPIYPVTYTLHSGGAGGYCVRTNGYSVTWSATGTRYGGIG